VERYECDQCGACCKGHLIVEADDLDVMREPKLLSADEHYTGLAAEEGVEALRGDIGRCVLIACGGPCAFLEDNRCSIYPTRPNACVGLLPGDEQCQIARAEEGVAPLKHSGARRQAAGLER
jgi:Fe-S-cluster containining protein